MGAGQGYIHWFCCFHILHKNCTKKSTASISWSGHCRAFRCGNGDKLFLSDRASLSEAASLSLRAEGVGRNVTGEGQELPSKVLSSML